MPKAPKSRDFTEKVRTERCFRGLYFAMCTHLRCPRQKERQMQYTMPSTMVRWAGVPVEWIGACVI